MKIKIITLLCAVCFCTEPLFANNYRSGMAYYKSKRYEKAREHLLLVKDNGNACYVLGDIAKLMGDFSEAESWFNKAIESPSTSQTNLRNSYWSLIALCEQRGDYERVALICKETWTRMGEQAARQKIETIINKRQWSDNKEAVAVYEQGVAYKKQHNSKEATACFYDAVGLDGKFLAPKFELGLAALNANNLSDAEYYLKAVTSKIPYYAEANIALGDVYFYKRNFRSALGCYGNAEKFGILGKDMNYHISIKQAQCYYDMGYMNDAEETANKAGELAPSKVEPLTILSAIYIKQKDLDKALAVLKKAEMVEPNNLGVQYQMGSIYYSREDERYIACFDKIFVRTKTKEKPAYPKTIPILIEGHYKNKNYPKVNEITETYPAELKTYDLKMLNAKSYYYRRQYDKAISELKRLNLTKDDKLVLAVASVKANKRDEAKSIVKAMFNQEEYKEKARKYKSLAPIVDEIEQEKAAAERERLEREERLRQEREQREAERQARLNGEKQTNDSEVKTTRSSGSKQVTKENGNAHGSSDEGGGQN